MGLEVLGIEAEIHVICLAGGGIAGKTEPEPLCCLMTHRARCKLPGLRARLAPQENINQSLIEPRLRNAVSSRIV